MIVPSSSTSKWQYTPGATPSGLNAIDSSSDFSILLWTRAQSADPTADVNIAYFYTGSNFLWIMFSYGSDAFQVRASGGSATIPCQLPWNYGSTKAGDLGKWHLVGLSYNAATNSITLMVMAEGDTTATTVSGSITPAGGDDWGTIQNFTGGDQAARDPWGSGGAYGTVAVRDHQMTAAEFAAVFAAGYGAPMDYDNSGGGGNFAGLAGVQWAFDHALMGDPKKATGESVTPTDALPGDAVVTTNMIVFDPVRENDLRTVYDDNVVSGTAATYADPFAEDFFTPDECTAQSAGLPISGTADALRRLADDNPAGVHWIMSQGNSRATRVNVDDYFATSCGQCFPSGLAAFLHEQRGSGLVGCCVPAVSFGVFACWPFVALVSPAKTGTVTTIGGGSGTYDDFSRIGVGNNNASGTAMGQHVHLAASSSLQLVFDVRPSGPLGDFDPDTEDLVVFAVIPKFPGGGDLDVSATRTTAANALGTAVGSATTVNQDSAAAAGTVKSWVSGTKTLTIDEEITVGAGELIFVDSGTGAGSLLQAAANGVVSGDTIVTTTHGAHANPVLGDTVQVGPVEWQVVQKTIPAGTLASNEYAGVLIATGAGNSRGIVSMVGCYVDKPGFATVVMGHSGHGYGLQQAEAFVVEDASGRNPVGKLLAALCAMFPTPRHAYCMHLANQGSVTSDLGAWTDMVQAQAVDGLDLAWLLEGTNPADDADFDDNALGSDWGDYGAANAAGKSVSCVASQVAGGVRTGRDALISGWYANSADHFSSLGNVEQWNLWIGQGASAWLVEVSAGGRRSRSRDRRVR